MNNLQSIHRTGATTGSVGTTAASAADRANGASFGKTLECAIDTTQAARQRYDDGKGGHGRSLVGAAVTRSDLAGANASAAPAALQLKAKQQTADAGVPAAAVFAGLAAFAGSAGIAATHAASAADSGARAAAAGGTGALDAAGAAPLLAQTATDYQGPKSSLVNPNPEVQPLDTAKCTLDPGSMAFLLAWMGGGGPAVEGQTVRAQQQSYLDTYRDRYATGVTGVKDYISATTNYLTRTS